MILHLHDGVPQLSVRGRTFEQLCSTFPKLCSEIDDLLFLPFGLGKHFQDASPRTDRRRSAVGRAGDDVLEDEPPQFRYFGNQAIYPAVGFARSTLRTTSVMSPEPEFMAVLMQRYLLLLHCVHLVIDVKIALCVHGLCRRSREDGTICSSDLAPSLSSLRQHSTALPTRGAYWEQHGSRLASIYKRC